MCVAAIIYGSVSLSDLRRMEATNRDGAGMAWLDHSTGRIVYRRGLKATEIHEILEKEASRPALVHFRYATQGSERAALCHPFPIGPQAFSEDVHGSAEAVLIHNGTWRDYDMFVPDEMLGKDVSDTQVAAYVAGWWEGVLEDVQWATAIARVNATHHQEGTMHSLAITERGTWYDHTDGNRYSNLSWVPGRYSGSITYKGWDWDDWNEWRNDKGTGASITVKSPHSGKVIRMLAPVRARDCERPTRESRKSRKRRERRERREAAIAARARASRTDSDPSATIPMRRVEGCEPAWITERTRALLTEEPELRAWDERVIDSDNVIPDVYDVIASASSGELRAWRDAELAEAGIVKGEAWCDDERASVESYLARWSDIGGSD